MLWGNRPRRKNKNKDRSKIVDESPDTSIGVSPLNDSNIEDKQDKTIVEKDKSLQGNKSAVDKTVNKSKAKSTDANADENEDDDEASKTLVNDDDDETTETTLQSNDGNKSTNPKLSPEKEKSKRKSRLRSSAPTEVEPSQDENKESEVNTRKSSEKTSDSEAVIKEVVLPDKDKPGDKDGGAKTSESDLDKSKRVSGQGMARPKTPTKTKKFHNLRAISTPQVNKSVLGENVTFLGESVMDLSAITVLSPPSSLNDPDSRRTSSNKDDTDAVSFRFKKGGRDLFEKLVSNDRQPPSSEETGKRKKVDLSPDKEKNPSKKTRSSSGLDNIEEEENQVPAASEDNVDGKRRRSRRR